MFKRLISKDWKRREEDTSRRRNNKMTRFFSKIQILLDTCDWMSKNISNVILLKAEFSFSLAVISQKTLPSSHSDNPEIEESALTVLSHSLFSNPPKNLLDYFISLHTPWYPSQGNHLRASRLPGSILLFCPLWAVLPLCSHKIQIFSPHRLKPFSDFSFWKH